MLVDGTDGVLAARTQRLAQAGSSRAKRASSVLVVLFSFSLVTAEIRKWDVDRVAFPLGLVLFLALIGLHL